MTELLQYITTSVNFGVLGLVFWLFVGGRLHSDEEYKSMRADYSEERKAHDLTRQALALANERANTSVLTGQLVLQAINGQARPAGGGTA